MPLLDWKHHTLIQALLTRGPLPEKEFRSIFNGVTGLNSGSHTELFNEYLLKINKELSYVQLDLRACRDQYTGQIYYGIANNVSDEQSKLGTHYSAPQIAFFKGIVEAITQDGTGQGCISNIDALNIRLEDQVLGESGSQSQNSSTQIPPAFRNFTLSQKEKALQELVKDKWLCRPEDGQIGLGIRSILDLRGWFRNADVPPCQICNETGLKANVCPNEGCTARIHLYCLKKKCSQTGQIECPSCGTQWPYQVPKSEAIEEEDEMEGPSQSQQPSQGSKRQRQRSSQVNGADIVGNGSQDSKSDPNSRRVTRSSRRMS